MRNAMLSLCVGSMLCIGFADALRADPLSSSTAAWTVFEGFQDTTYAVAPSASSPAPPVVPTTAGLTVAFAAAQPGRFVTTLDNVAQSGAENRIHVKVEIWRCLSAVSCPPVDQNPDEIWNVWVNPDFHIYSIYSKANKTVLGSSLNSHPSVSSTSPPGASPNASLWAGVITIPWDQVRIGVSEHIVVSMAYVQPDGVDSPAKLADAIANFVSEFGAGWDPTSDHRILSASKTAQWFKTEESTQTPTPAPRWPSVSLDANYPASDYALGGFTFAQSSANVLVNLQKKIASAASAAGPTKSTPAPCAPCQSFETRYSSLVGLPASSSAFTSDAPGVAGIDAQPFSLLDLSNLGFGGIESFWSSRVNATIAQAYTRNALDDEALEIGDTTGAAQLTVLAASRNHPAVPGATPPPLPLAAPVLHASTDAASFVWANPTIHDADANDNGAGRFEASDVVALLRDAYDATDSGSDAFGGIEFVRQSVDKADSNDAPKEHGWQADTFAAIPGYRSSALSYRTLDGDPLVYPFVSGPTFTAGIAEASNGGFTRKATVASYWLKNALGDFENSDDYVVTDQLRASRSFILSSVSYEVNRTSISAPLLGATQASGFAYPALRNFIAPAPGASPAPPGAFEQSDNTLSFSASSPLDTSIAYQFKLGYDFRHIAAQCQTDPLAATHLFCSQTPATHFEIYAFNITSPYYRIGYTLQPTKYSAGNTLVTAERVYNGFLQASLPRDKNVTVFASASNDTGVLAFVPVSRLIEATNIQLNITGEIKGIGDVLSVGATNQNGFLSNIPGEGLNFSRFPQRVLTTFVLVRIGTPALLTTPVSPGF